MLISAGPRIDTTDQVKNVTSISSEEFKEICSTVWRDRRRVLAGRGFLTGEAALMRAVYWRLSNKGLLSNSVPENYSSVESILTYETVVLCVVELSATPRFDGKPILNELCELYRKEFSRDAQN